MIESGIKTTLEFLYNFIAIEALSAVKGSGSSMDVLKVMNTGKTFEESFASVYGLSLNEALPIISEAVSLEFKQYKLTS